MDASMHHINVWLCNSPVSHTMCQSLSILRVKHRSRRQNRPNLEELYPLDGDSSSGYHVDHATLVTWNQTPAATYNHSPPFVTFTTWLCTYCHSTLYYVCRVHSMSCSCRHSLTLKWLSDVEEHILRNIKNTIIVETWRGTLCVEQHFW